MGDSELKAGQGVPGTPYRVLRLLGSGGMGSVYEVEHTELGKRFVLKALRGGLAARRDLAQRLRNECRALGRLEHPNIVSVTDAGVTPRGNPYFVMERLQGETLASRLKHGRPLQVLEALHVATQILDGLHAAHGIGIVHRDIKPPNIFLVDGGIVKLLDFGIAKTLDREAAQITGRGVAIGTPRYMAPEQASGASIDERTDLYSVGLVLYEMLAGRGPFDDIRDPNEVFLAHMTQVPPRLLGLVPEVPPDLDEITARALAKTPAHRPRNAAEMAASLRDVASRLAQRPSVPSLPDWIHAGPTVPGTPLETGSSGERFDTRSVVTRTLVVESSFEGALPANTLAPGTTRDTRSAVPELAPPSSDHTGPTRTITLLEPELGGALAVHHTVDMEEPETRTALGVEQSTTAPPISTGSVSAVPEGRRGPFVWGALIAAACASAAVTTAAVWSLHADGAAVLGEAPVNAPLSGPAAAAATPPEVPDPDPDIVDSPSSGATASPKPSALEKPPAPAVASAPSPPPSSTVRVPQRSQLGGRKTSTVAVEETPPGPTRPQALRTAPAVASPDPGPRAEAVRPSVAVVDDVVSPWDRVADPASRTPIDPPAALPGAPKKPDGLPASGL